MLEERINILLSCKYSLSSEDPKGLGLFEQAKQSRGEELFN